MSGFTPEAIPYGSSPEIPEPIGRKLGVPDRVLDVFVPEIGLQRAGVVAGIG
jgi:hypothetical protein